VSEFTTIPAIVVESSRAWLASLDSSSYSKAWEHAAATMHSCMSQSDFDKGMQSIRAPLGKVESRDIKSQRHVTRLPGLPEGDYWVVSYITTFENKPNVTESIVLALEQNGNWRVAGYLLP
jgi:hypothetical protein